MSENLNNDQIISADFEVSTELDIQLGSVYQGSSVDSLSELSDVAIDRSTLANGNSLTYDSTSGKWTNGEVAPGVDDLSELGDVSITTPSNDQILRYNSTSGKWVNSAESAAPSDLNGLDDVSITSPSADQILRYDSVSEKWINGEITPGASDLSDLGDVAISSPSNDQILKYNSTSGKWENGTGSGTSALNDLNDVNISSASDKEYLTYNNSTHKWENKDINSILSSTTRGEYCNFYTPLSADFLNCRVYAGLRVDSGTPTPNSPRFPIAYQTLAVGSCHDSGSYSYYLSGLFKTLEYDGGCTWYLDLGNLTWNYEDGVFKAEGYFFNKPKENFNCICSNNAYTYKGSDTSYADKTIGYWSPYEGQFAFWIRDEQFNGNVSEFTSHVSGIYTLYETKENGSSISINNYNMILSVFGLDGWAIKISYVDLTQDMYAGEWDVVNKCVYYTWAVRPQTDMLSGYTINNQYVIYDASEWDFGLKPDCDAFCTNFAFEPNTETPSVNCFSIFNNKVIFNIASLQSSWSDWIQSNTTFKLHYETSDITSSYLYYSDIPTTYKIMNFMWSNAKDGSVEAQYYSGDATPYIDFTNIIISNTELGNLDNVDISGVQDGQVLKYNSTSGKWKNSAEESAWTDIAGTLTTGQTSITLSDAVITTNSMVEIFTPDGIEWNSITVAVGSVTVTFDAQLSDMIVIARITQWHG